MDTIKCKATFPRKFITGAALAWNTNHVEGTSSWGAFQLPSPEDTSDSSRSTSYDAPEICRVCRGQIGGEGADELRERVVNLERNYQTLMEEYRRDMGRQQRLIQRLIAYLEGTKGESQGWHVHALFSRMRLMSFRSKRTNRMQAPAVGLRNWPGHPPSKATVQNSRRWEDESAAATRPSGMWDVRFSRDTTNLRG